jgi:hypothetical protein
MKAARSLAPNEWHALLAASDVKGIERAIERGDVFERCPVRGSGVLRFAALNGNEAICRALVRAGHDVNDLSSDESTPLSGAANRGYVALCRFLVSAGANPALTPPAASKGYLTPFQRAVFQGQPLVVRYFLEEAGQSLSQRTVDGRTLMELARSQPAVTQELLSWQTRAVMDRAMAKPAGSRRKNGSWRAEATAL